MLLKPQQTTITATVVQFLFLMDKRNEERKSRRTQIPLSFQSRKTS